MFTRQHYEKLARHINENQENFYGRYYDLDSLCRFFKQDNPRFNAKTFRVACGYKEAK